VFSYFCISPAFLGSLFSCNGRNAKCIWAVRYQHLNYNTLTAVRITIIIVKRIETCIMRYISTSHYYYYYYLIFISKADGKHAKLTKNSYFKRQLLLTNRFCNLSKVSLSFFFLSLRALSLGKGSTPASNSRVNSKIYNILGLQQLLWESDDKRRGSHVGWVYNKR